jgi:hypothetical protein
MIRKFLAKQWNRQHVILIHETVPLTCLSCKTTILKSFYSRVLTLYRTESIVDWEEPDLEDASTKIQVLETKPLVMQK